MDPLMKSTQKFQAVRKLEKATNKMRKMTLQDESVGLSQTIQMPKTPYIRPNNNIPLIRSPFTLPKSQVLQVSQYKLGGDQMYQGTSDLQAHQQVCDDQVANQSTFDSIENSSYESPFRLVTWQTVLQECDDEMEESTPTATVAQTGRLFNSSSKGTVRFNLPQSFAAPEGHDYNSLSANLRLLNQQPFVSGTPQFNSDTTQSPLLLNSQQSPQQMPSLFNLTNACHTNNLINQGSTHQPTTQSNNQPNFNQQSSIPSIKNFLFQQTYEGCDEGRLLLHSFVYLVRKRGSERVPALSLMYNYINNLTILSFSTSFTPNKAVFIGYQQRVRPIFWLTTMGQ
eukprot:403334685